MSSLIYYEVFQMNRKVMFSYHLHNSFIHCDLRKIILFNRREPNQKSTGFPSSGKIFIFSYVYYIGPLEYIYYIRYLATLSLNLISFMRIQHHSKLFLKYCPIIINHATNLVCTILPPKCIFLLAFNI